MAFFEKIIIIKLVVRNQNITVQGDIMVKEYVVVAPENYSRRVDVDFKCTGKNDELTIQRAIDEAIELNSNIMLLNGIYHIDGFNNYYDDNGPDSAICFPNEWREIKFIGENAEYGFQRKYNNGVVLLVSSNALKTIERETDVIRGRWTEAGIQNGSSLCMENISIVLANNQHKIRCIDLRRTDRPELKNITLVSYGDMISENSDNGLGTPPPVPTKGCIGLTMTDGSNNSYSNYTNVQTYGFDEGIQVGGEHVVCINCGAAVGRYGFTFGNYETNCGSNHPITLINCMDERNINLPLFNMCGDADGKGGRLQGRQEVTLISFNMERVERQTPGRMLGDLMKEVHPGTWCGTIDFTLQPDWCALNSVDFKIWESDGSGRNIKTRNSCHKTVCTTAERLDYYPTLGQQIFDTDLNKMVICIEPEDRKWVDFMGNPV